MENSKFDLPSIYFLSNSGVVVVFSYLILLLKEKGIDETEIGLLAIPFSISLIISNTFFGRMSDAKGRRPFLLVGLFTSSFTTVLYIFPDTFWMFALARILNGITLGMFPSSIIGTASDRNIKIGKLSSFGSFGWAAGGLLGGFIADYYDLEVAFVIAGFLYFLAFLTTYIMHTGRKTEAINEREGPTNQLNPNYMQVLKQNWLVYMTVILRHGSANAIWIFWALFLTEDLGLSTTQIGVVQATNMMTQFVFMRTTGDRFDPSTMFVFGGFTSALAFYTFTISENFVHIVLTQVILGTSWAFFYVGGLRNVERKAYSDNTVATATGLFNASTSIPQLIGPPLAIYLYSISEDYTLSMQVASIITIIATFLYSILEFSKRSPISK
jgi:MFS family permease